MDHSHDRLWYLTRGVPSVTFAARDSYRAKATQNCAAGEECQDDLSNEVIIWSPEMYCCGKGPSGKVKRDLRIQQLCCTLFALYNWIKLYERSHRRHETLSALLSEMTTSLDGMISSTSCGTSSTAQMSSWRLRDDSARRVSCIIFSITPEKAAKSSTHTISTTRKSARWTLTISIACSAIWRMISTSDMTLQRTATVSQPISLKTGGKDITRFRHWEMMTCAR